MGMVWEYLERQPFVLALISVTALISTLMFIVMSTFDVERPRPIAHQWTKKYSKYPLLSRTEVAKNTYIYKVGLKNEVPLGLPLGQGLQVRAIIEGEVVERTFTPITASDKKGPFELLMKTYSAPEGKMTRFISELPLGSFIEIRGPVGEFKYRKGMCRHLCLIAWGIGIAPCFTVLSQILNDMEDYTLVSLMYTNNRKEDIMLYDQLNHLAKQNAKQFHLLYVLSDPPENWSGASGTATKLIYEKKFGALHENVLIGTCGPPLMSKSTKAALLDAGYKYEQVFQF